MNYSLVLILSLCSVFANAQNPETSNPFAESKCGDVFTRLCNRRSKYRSIDGSCNNPVNPTWGMTYTRYARLIPANYADWYYAPRKARSGNHLPWARILSRVLSPDKKLLDKKYTALALQWTQVVTHDLLLTDSRNNTEETNCCSEQGKIVREPTLAPLCYPALIPEDDPDFGSSGIRCFNSFIRKFTDVDRGCAARNGVHNQLSITTHYSDLSTVYGSTDEEAANLREFKGGRLRADIRRNQEWPPHDDNCLPEAEVCYKTGDRRINLGIQLAFFVVAMLREHNRIARELSKINPHWNDERVYQETRRIYIAMNQQITYYEWIPIFMGAENSYAHKLIYKTKNYVNDYNPSQDASTLNEMVAAVFRAFHTILAGEYDMVNEKRDPPHGKANVNKLFLNPSIIEKGDNYDCLMRGLSTQPQEAVDQYYSDEFTVNLNLGSKIVRSDGRALDIHRGREQGLGTYNQYRKFCGFPEADEWEDFLDFIPEQDVTEMRKIYESPHDVDFTVGASSERSVPGALVGPTFLCVLNEQFYRTRVGDRFFFENGKSGFPFTLAQLKEIRKYTISRLVCDNTDTKSMQRRGFEQISTENPLVSCDLIPKINLSLWKE